MKKLLGIVLAACMLLSVTACNNTKPENQETKPTATEATTGAAPDVPQIESKAYQTIKSDKKLNDQGLADNIDDGVILHAFCWSFNTIKENMKDIAKAGYSSIQTSPINLCKEGEGGGMQLQDTPDSANKGKWYYHYQPVDYTIGNYQLGTEEEFKDMCKEADKHGIKIIVDAVVNHMSSDKSVISDNIKNLEDPFHHNGEVSDYGNRKEATQGNLLGLIDLNTQNEAIQNYVLNYLQTCVEAGASGFRYDGAKHVELEDDDKAYASHFWDIVTNNGSKFQYGEILQGGADRIKSYSKKMNITASKYGEYLRDGLNNSDLSVGSLINYNVNGVEPSKLVTWVESHDNYCNDGSWRQLDEAAIKQGWAIITARSGGTPLFFSRPMGSSVSNQWGDNQIGKAGSDFYKDKEVVQVNQFRNNMIGLDETLSNPMDSQEVMMIERGDKGAVIVSVGTEDLSLKDVNSTLQDGTYKDHVSNATFTVKGGKINGTVKAGQVVVLYNQ